MIGFLKSPIIRVQHPAGVGAEIAHDSSALNFFFIIYLFFGTARRMKLQDGGNGTNGQMLKLNQIIYNKSF